MKFKVQYQVNGSILNFNIESSEIEDDMTIDDIKELYHDHIKNDFEQKVSPEGENEESFIKWANNAILKRDNVD